MAQPFVSSHSEGQNDFSLCPAGAAAARDRELEEGGSPEHSEQQGTRAVSKKHRLLLDKAVGSVSPVLKGALFSVLVRG